MVKLSVCEAAQTGVPGVGGSAVKLYYTELYQRIDRARHARCSAAPRSRATTSPGCPTDEIALQGAAVALAHDRGGHARRSSATSSPSASSACPKEPLSRWTSGSSDDQEALRAGHPLVLRRAPPDRGAARAREARRLRPRALERARRDGRLLAAPARERRAASGSACADAVIVFAELGRRLVPGPLVWSHLAAGLVAGRGRRARRSSAASTAAPRRRSRCSSSTSTTLDALLVLTPDGVERVDPRALDGEPVATPLDPLTPRRTRCARCPQGERIAGADDARAAAPRGRGARRGAAARHRRDDARSSPSTTRRSASSSAARSAASRRSSTCCADMFVRQEVARAAVYAAGATLDDPEVGDVRRAPSPARS